MATDLDVPRSRRAVLAAAMGAAAATVVSAIERPVTAGFVRQKNFTDAVPGRAMIEAGRSHVDVDVGALLDEANWEHLYPSTPKWQGVANLVFYRPGVYVAAVRPKYPSSRYMRIKLNRAVTKATPVAFIISGWWRYP